MIHLLEDYGETSLPEVNFSGSRDANIHSVLHHDKNLGKFLKAFQDYLKTGNKDEYKETLLTLGSTETEAARLVKHAESQKIASEKYRKK